MTDFTKEIAARYPSPKDINTILIEARQLRAKAMRDGATSVWSMFQRAMASPPVPAKTSPV